MSPSAHARLDIAPPGIEGSWMVRVLEGLRIGAVLTGVGVVTLIGIPTQWIALKLKLPARRFIPCLYHRFLLKALGVRVTVRGVPDPRRPLLLLSNHVSWLDIPVIGSRAPLFFVAKSEVARWPLIGLLARFQRSVFVDRQKRQTIGSVNRQIAGRLADGDPVVLFAEGTSSDGNRVLPFRSALVGAVQDAFAIHDDVIVQPLAITYTRVQGLPMGRTHRPLAAWYGDMDLVPHLFEVLRQGAIDVEVTFLPPLWIDAPHDRKGITRAAEVAVRHEVALNLRGKKM